MSKYSMYVLLLGFFLLCAILPDTSMAEEVVDEAGKIEPGKYWDHITAAYVVTWLALIGYTLSLWTRRIKRSQ